MENERVADPWGIMLEKKAVQGRYSSEKKPTGSDAFEMMWNAVAMQKTGEW